MGEQEPHPFRQVFMLRPKTLDQCHKGRSTAMRGQNRLSVLTTERIIRVIIHGSRKESTVHVQQSFIAPVSMAAKKLKGDSCENTH